MVHPARPDYRPAVKNTNFRGYTLAGAAALFVGFAGNVHAVPISDLNDLSTGKWSEAQSHFAAGHFFDQHDRPPIYVSPIAAFLFQSVRAQHAGEPWDFGPAKYHREIFGGPVTSSVLTVSPRATAGVPDGASTAVLLGVACGGLFLWPKKRKV